ncbi:hypothetical protein ABK040_008736 [Willaertia magna]
MDQLVNEIILHLFDFLIIPPKDFISLFLLNKHWKENTLDDFTFWERQLSNLLFIFCKHEQLIVEPITFDLFYKTYLFNFHKLKPQLMNSFFFNNKRTFLEYLCKTIYEKKSCKDIKFAFTKLYDYLIKENALRKYKNNEYSLSYNYIEKISIKKYNNLFFNLQESYENVFFYLDSLIDSYNNQIFSEKEFAYGIDKIFNEKVLKKERKFYETLNTSFYYKRNKTTLLVELICKYLENVEKYELMYEKIKYSLQQLFLLKNRNQIFCFLFIKIFKKLNFKKEQIIHFICFLKTLSDLFGKHHFTISNNVTTSSYLLDRNRISDEIIDICSFIEDFQYEFLDFLFHHFHFDSSVYTDLIFQAKHNDKDELALTVLKLMAGNKRCLVKVKDMCKNNTGRCKYNFLFDLIQFKDFNLFKEGYNYVYKLIYKENNDKFLSLKQLLKYLINYLNINDIFKGEDEFVFLKFNFLKELFNNNPKMEKEYKLFKKMIFKQFIESIFNYSSEFIINCIKYFVKEWDLNFNTLFSKRNVTTDYLLQTISLQKIYNYIENDLTNTFEIIIYDLQMTLLTIVEYQYRTLSLEHFNEIINYLKDNKLFDFNKKLYIAKINYHLNDTCHKREYIKEINQTVLWKEITTTNLIERIKKFKEWE